MANEKSKSKKKPSRASIPPKTFPREVQPQRQPQGIKPTGIPAAQPSMPEPDFFKLPIPKELTQVPTFINDPSKLSGDKEMTPYANNPVSWTLGGYDPDVNPENTSELMKQQTGLGTPQGMMGIQPTGMPQQQPAQPGQPDEKFAQSQGQGLAKGISPTGMPAPGQPQDQQQKTNIGAQPQGLPDPAGKLKEEYGLQNSAPIVANNGPESLGYVPGFEEGGFTGPGPEDKPAGIVHAGEYVFPAEVVDALGIDFLENLKNNAFKGYAEGGAVTATTKPLSFVEWAKKNTRGPMTLETLKQYNAYKSKLSSSTPKPNPTPTPTPKPTPTPLKPIPEGVGKIVAGAPEYKGQVNIADYGAKVAEDPKIGFSKEMLLSGKVGQIDENAQGTNISKAPYQMDEAGVNQQAATGQTAFGTAGQAAFTKAGTAQGQTALGTVSTAQKAKQGPVNTYTAKTTIDDIMANGQMEAAQGELSDGSIIDDSEIAQHDIEGHATGQTALGQALNDYASQDLNAVDPRATMRGQLQLLQSEFVDPVTGEPRIPAWAAESARSVSRIAAFKGMTGSAATAAMAQAIMESSLPIAQQDAQFFQTLTIKNLDNKQASIINKANILSKMELANVDNRMAAAIQNAKHFMEMDMKNLDNRQQAQVLNMQARVQSIFEDAKAVNTQRMFTADAKNDMDKFYAELGTQVEMFNSSQRNNMSQFNATQRNDMTKFNVSERNDISKFNAGQANAMSMFNAGERSVMSRFNADSRNDMTKFNINEVNAMRKFNAEIENQREQFEKNMSYNIDVSNAKWRQTVTLTESDQKFQAAATDVRNMFDMSTEQLNRLWDRSDNLLQFIHTSAENEMDRKAAIAIKKLEAKLASKEADAQGWGSIFGSIAGKVGEGLVSWLF